MLKAAYEHIQSTRQELPVDLHIFLEAMRNLEVMELTETMMEKAFVCSKL